MPISVRFDWFFEKVHTKLFIGANNLSKINEEMAEISPVCRLVGRYADQMLRTSIVVPLYDICSYLFLLMLMARVHARIIPINGNIATPMEAAPIVDKFSLMISTTLS